MNSIFNPFSESFFGHVAALVMTFRSVSVKEKKNVSVPYRNDRFKQFTRMYAVQRVVKTDNCFVFLKPCV